jgi:hypothetical protein
VKVFFGQALCQFRLLRSRNPRASEAKIFKYYLFFCIDRQEYW